LTLLLLFTSNSYIYAKAETITQKGKLKCTSIKEKRKELWKSFNKIRNKKFGKLKKIDLYAENDSLTRICFICDKGLFVFYWNKEEGHIERIRHAKMIVYDRINRITFDRKREAFKLWYYGTEELSIGAG